MGKLYLNKRNVNRYLFGLFYRTKCLTTVEFVLTYRRLLDPWMNTCYDEASIFEWKIVNCLLQRSWKSLFWVTHSHDTNVYGKIEQHHVVVLHILQVRLQMEKTQAKNWKTRSNNVKMYHYLHDYLFSVKWFGHFLVVLCPLTNKCNLIFIFQNTVLSLHKIF